MSAHASLKHAINQLEAEAYKRGWEEAMAAIQKAAVNVQKDLFANPVRDDSLQDRSTIELVREIIETSPGLTGVQIVEKATMKDPAAHERTVRTALRRLRMREIIRNENNRWFMNIKIVCKNIT